MYLGNAPHYFLNVKLSYAVGVIHVPLVPTSTLKTGSHAARTMKEDFVECIAVVMSNVTAALT